MFALILMAWYAGSPAALCQPMAVDDADFRGLPTEKPVLDILRDLHTQRDADNPEAVLSRFRTLLTGDPGSLVPVDENHLLPAWRVVQREFHTLKDQHQATLRAGSAAAARLELLRIVREGDWKAVPTLVHRNPGTDSAYAAQLLIARRNLETGLRVAAEIWLSELDVDGVPDRFRNAAARLRNRGLLPADRPAGDSDDAKLPPVALPTNIRWEQRETLGDEMSLQVESAVVETPAIPETAWNAIVDSGFVYRRTLRGIAALKLDTGEFQLHFRMSPSHIDHLDRLTTIRQPLRQRGGQLDDESLLSQSTLSTAFLDAARTARIAADSHCLFAVVDASSGILPQPSNPIQAPPVLPDCRLIAVDRTSGRRVWSIGGPSTERTSPTGFGGSWFAGAPSVHGTHLYAVIERKGELQCVTLRASTGEPVASTLLAFPESTIERDHNRRTFGLTPVFESGLIVCPTGLGWIIAVDSLTQSIIWTARSTPLNEAPFPAGMWRREREMSSGSGRALAEVHLDDRTAVVLPANSNDCLFIDLVSGRIVEQHSGLEFATVLARLDDVNDPGFIVAFSPGNHGIHENPSTHAGVSIQRFSSSTHDILWTTPAERDERPIGHGLIRGDQLIYMTASGGLVARNIENGAVTQEVPCILPHPFRAHPADVTLLNAPRRHDDSKAADIVILTPTRTLSLTTEVSDRPPRSQLTQARFHFEEGRFDESWAVLSNLPPSKFKDRDAEELRFRVAVELALSDRLPADVRMSDLQPGFSHQQIASIIDLSRRFQSDPSGTTLAVVEFARDLQPNESMVPAELLPTAFQDKKSSDGNPPAIAADSETRAQVSAGYWAAAMIRYGMDELDESARSSLTEEFRNLPTSMLLLLNDAVPLTILLERIQNEIRPEAAFRLLKQAASAADRANTADKTASHVIPDWSDVPAWKSIAADPTAPDLRSECLQLLMASVSDECEAAFAARLKSALIPDFTDKRIADTRRRQSEWIHDDYRTIPVARPADFGMHPIRLTATDPDDPLTQSVAFLMHRDPPRLQMIRSGSPGQESTSIPGVFPWSGHHRNSTVWRSGSVIMIASGDSLTAVSLLDDRALWSRQLDSQARDASMEVDSIDDERIDLTGTDRLTASLQTSGNGMDWLCLRTPQAVELVDSYSGQTRWKYPAASTDRCVCNEDVVLIFGESVRTDGDEIPLKSSSLTVLDRQSGAVVEAGLEVSQVRNILCGSGSDFAMWESDADQESSGRVVWKDARTGEEHGRLEFPDYVRRQFTDGKTLIVTGSDRQVSMVDLKTRKRTDYSWSEVSHPDETHKTQPVWDAEMMHVARSADYIFLLDCSGTDTSVSAQRQIPFGRLRVLDRQTGQHLWEASDLRNATLSAHEPGIPFLPVVERWRKDPSQPTLVQLRGFNLRSGTRLFQERFPARNDYGISRQQITAHPDFAVSAELNGCRLRFERK